MSTTHIKSTNEKRQRPPWLPSKVRLARSLLYLIIIGLAVYILLPQITSIEESIRVLRSMSPWLVGLALLARWAVTLVVDTFSKRSLIWEKPN